MTRVLQELKQRRLGRRWQHWSEIDPADDYARRAGIGMVFVLALFLLVGVLVVVGLVVAR